MGTAGTITLGSRGSDLALTQARMVEQALRAACPELEVRLEIIRTSGDEGSRVEPVVDRKAGRKGMFTREIEKQLLVRRIDLAVHSAKDLPSDRGEELEVRAALPRAHTEDVLILKEAAGLTGLPAGATIATGSIRRAHQLRWQRPDLQVADLRGNVPTRLRKLGENPDWSGIILARAGMERLGMSVGQPKRPPYNCQILSPNDFVPAGGQGIIALQIRREDEQVRALVDAINHAPTLLALRAEREFLRLLDGDCDSPVGVQATIAEDEMTLRAQVFTEETSPPQAGEARGPASEPEKLAAELMEKLYGN